MPDRNTQITTPVAGLITADFDTLQQGRPQTNTQLSFYAQTNTGQDVNLTVTGYLYESQGRRYFAPDYLQVDGKNVAEFTNLGRTIPVDNDVAGGTASCSIEDFCRDNPQFLATINNTFAANPGLW